jgi:ubiquinone/menaquinone biosynthesis C-methylase UbiE
MKDLMGVRKSRDTAKFYDALMDGQAERSFLGKDRRFNVLRVAQLPSVQKHYVDVVRPYIGMDDLVLDFGCGPGTFLIPIASFCREIVGAEISARFVQEGQTIIDQLQVKNARFITIEPDVLPFEDGSFDVLLLFDVIHHLENIDVSLTEAFRVLKPGGRVIIYEPNKLNPLLYFVHLLDRNEWGLLKLGTPAKYRQVLAPFVKIEGISFNGIVIGPQSKIYNSLSDLLNKPGWVSWMGWLNPKMFITGTKAGP